MLVRAGQPGTYQLLKLDYDQGFGGGALETLATVVVLPSGEPPMALPSALPPPPLTTIGSSEIYNQDDEDHPFHIHVNPFQVVSINDEPVNPPTWQDTVLLPKNNGKVVIRTRFRDSDGMFVLHCHILLHQCAGMMQVVNVVPPGVSHEERERRRRHAREIVAAQMPTPAMMREFCGRRMP